MVARTGRHTMPPDARVEDPGGRPRPRGLLFVLPPPGDAERPEATLAGYLVARCCGYLAEGRRDPQARYFGPLERAQALEAVTKFYRVHLETARKWIAAALDAELLQLDGEDRLVPSLEALEARWETNRDRGCKITGEQLEALTTARGRAAAIVFVGFVSDESRAYKLGVTLTARKLGWELDRVRKLVATLRGTLIGTVGRGGMGIGPVEPQRMGASRQRMGADSQRIGADRQRIGATSNQRTREPEITSNPPTVPHLRLVEPEPSLPPGGGGDRGSDPVMPDRVTTAKTRIERVSSWAVALAAHQKTTGNPSLVIETTSRLVTLFEALDPIAPYVEGLTPKHASRKRTRFLQARMRAAKKLLDKLGGSVCGERLARVALFLAKTDLVQVRAVVPYMVAALTSESPLDFDADRAATLSVGSGSSKRSVTVGYRFSPDIERELEGPYADAVRVVVTSLEVVMEARGRNVGVTMDARRGAAKNIAAAWAVREIAEAVRTLDLLLRTEPNRPKPSDLPGYVLRLVPELSETEARQLAVAYQARSA